MTTDQTQGTTWPANAERDALWRCRSFAAGNAFGVPVEAQGQHLEYLLAALTPHVARREREAAAGALREAADALAGQPAMIRSVYVRLLRLYAAEPWRLDGSIERGES